MKRRSFGIFILLFFLLPIFTVMISPISKAQTEDTTYIIANDLIKNFKVASFKGTPVSSSGLYGSNVKFDVQQSWIIKKEDVNLINYYTQGDHIYFRYKIVATTKVNAYTVLKLGQCAIKMEQVVDTHRIAYYRHNNWIGAWLYSWEAFVKWTHYDFGNIVNWNDMFNVYTGDVVMNFDIAQNPLPNFQTYSGDSLTKNFDYIAVSSAGVVSNLQGNLDNTVPKIVGISPLTDRQDKNSQTKDPLPNGKTDVTLSYPVNVRLYTQTSPKTQWEGGIVPPTIGSSLNPTTKAGLPIWNPTKQESMKDCKIQYTIKLSPIVREYYGTLAYNFISYTTQNYIGKGAQLKHDTSQYGITHTKPVALQCVNRYIQTDIQVVFDLFASYKIDARADGIEDKTLEIPEEYFEDVIWLTTADAMGDGHQYTKDKTLFDQIGDAIASLFDNIWTWIILIIILIVAVALVWYVFIPYLRSRSKRKR